MLPLSSLFTSIKRTTHQLIIHRVVTPLPQLSSSPRTHPDFHAHIHTPTRSRLSSCHPCCPFQPSSQQSFGFRYWLFRRSISYSSSLGSSSITFSTPPIHLLPLPADTYRHHRYHPYSSRYRHMHSHHLESQIGQLDCRRRHGFRHRHWHKGTHGRTTGWSRCRRCSCSCHNNINHC